MKSNPRPATHESRPAVCANPLFAGGIPKLKPTGCRTSATSSAPVPPPIRPPPNTAPRAPVPPPAPATVRRPAPPPAHSQPAAPQVRRVPVPEPVERGMSKLNISEERAAPFSAANLRKTGIDMTRQRSVAPPPPQMVAPVIKRPQQSRPVEKEIQVPKVPTSTGLASANGRWKFPIDDELPTPPPFQGVKKVYPSGRVNGITVAPEPVKITRPIPVASAPSTAKKAVPAGFKTGNPADLIDQKMRKLSDELKSAAANEEFEQCIELRGRIKKLKSLKEDVEQGFDISPAEINAA